MPPIFKTLNFSKLGLLIILGVGWMEKIFAWEGVPESIFEMTSSNFLTSWLNHFGPLFPNYFLGVFELIAFILLIFKEKYGALLCCIIFLTTISFLFNNFSFSIMKDFALLGVSIDLLVKNWKKTAY